MWSYAKLNSATQWSIRIFYFSFFNFFSVFFLYEYLISYFLILISLHKHDDSQNICRSKIPTPTAIRCNIIVKFKSNIYCTIISINTMNPLSMNTLTKSQLWTWSRFHQYLKLLYINFNPIRSFCRNWSYTMGDTWW